MKMHVIINLENKPNAKCYHIESDINCIRSLMIVIDDELVSSDALQKITFIPVERCS